MLNEIMQSIKNYFATGIYKNGTFTIENGTISLDFAVPGCFIKIEGSILNNGVYEYPTTELNDETFAGTICVLAPPADFLELCEEIEAHVKANKNKKKSPLQSESFDGYSYTRATTSTGAFADWRTVFGERLSAWRKI